MKIVVVLTDLRSETLSSGIRRVEVTMTFGALALVCCGRDVDATRRGVARVLIWRKG